MDQVPEIVIGLQLRIELLAALLQTRLKVLLVHVTDRHKTAALIGSEVQAGLTDTAYANDTPRHLVTGSRERLIPIHRSQHIAREDGEAGDAQARLLQEISSGFSHNDGIYVNLAIYEFIGSLANFHPPKRAFPWITLFPAGDLPRDLPCQRPFSWKVLPFPGGPSTPEAIFLEGPAFSRGTFHAGGRFPGRSCLFPGDLPRWRAFSRKVPRFSGGPSTLEGVFPEGPWGPRATWRLPQ